MHIINNQLSVISQFV